MIKVNLKRSENLFDYLKINCEAGEDAGQVFLDYCHGLLAFFACQSPDILDAEGLAKKILEAGDLVKKSSELISQMILFGAPGSHDITH